MTEERCSQKRPSHSKWQHRLDLKNQFCKCLKGVCKKMVVKLKEAILPNAHANVWQENVCLGV